jgi:phospholipid N-methyltransferase
MTQRNDLPSNDSIPSRRATPGDGRWLFFTKFLKRGKVIASFAPSSRFMVRALLRDIDFSRCQCIVELGAGTGPITKELIRRAPPHCRLLIVEIDPDLAAHLRRRFPGVDVVEADAADLDKLLDERGIEKVDHILSGLPLPSIPETIRERILDISARRLAEGGSFRQLTVMPLIYYALYRRYFHDVRFKFVPLNLPPGGVYVCQGFHGTKRKFRAKRSVWRWLQARRWRKRGVGQADARPPRK